MTDLDGQTAVVTGGGGGIGRAICLTVARHGAHVAVTDVDVERAEETTDLILSEGGHARAFEGDVTDHGSIERMRDEVTRWTEAPTLVVNNAGWSRSQPFLDSDPAFWDRIVRINLMGPVAVTHAFLPGMIELGRGGRIVNVASDAGRVGSLGESVYSGAKGGVIAFTKAVAREMTRHDILANCVSPGPTDTSLLADVPDKLRAALERAIPLRRLGRPEEVADAVYFFLSPQSAYMTGQVLSVSGGLTMAD